MSSAVGSNPSDLTHPTLLSDEDRFLYRTEHVPLLTASVVDDAQLRVSFVMRVARAMPSWLSIPLGIAAFAVVLLAIIPFFMAIVAGFKKGPVMVPGSDKTVSQNVQILTLVSSVALLSMCFVFM